MRGRDAIDAITCELSDVENSMKVLATLLNNLDETYIEPQFRGMDLPAGLRHLLTMLAEQIDRSRMRISQELDPKPAPQEVVNVRRMEA